MVENYIFQDYTKTFLMIPLLQVEATILVCDFYEKLVVSIFKIS